MTITLDLTAEEEERLRARATAAGMADPADYVRQLIDNTPQPNSRPTTGAELADALEALNLPPGYGDPDIDSPELARQLAARFSRPDRSGNR